MTALEYNEQQLFNKKLYSNNKISEFGGIWFKEWIHAQLNNKRWQGMVTDKLMLHALFNHFKLPCPEIYAVAFNYKRKYGEIPTFNDSERLADFIRNTIPYPFFCKPVKESQGRGIYRVEKYNKLSDQLILSNGKSMSVLDFIFSLNDGDGSGFLFQQFADTHSELTNICGDIISGCRVIMLLDDSGAQPFRIVWKIPAGTNHIDNFEQGKHGNMIADIDIKTGKIIRNVSSIDNKLIINQRHPTTNFDFTGYQLPNWDELITTAKKAAECFPGFRWQHWDIGISDSGPIIFELNSAGNTNIAQMASGQGVYNSQLNEFIRKYGNKKRRIGPLFNQAD